MRIQCDGRAVALAAVAAPVAAVLGLNQYKKRYVVGPEEMTGEYPGDEILGGPAAGMAIEIDAPPSRVWPLVNQLGQDKAGFYSFSIFERMVHFLIHNTYEPQARWQHTKVGDYCFFGQQGIGMTIVRHEPERYYVGHSDSRTPPTAEGAIAWVPAGMNGFAWTWGFYLEELPGNRTRLVVRTHRWAELAEGGKLKALIVAKLMWGWSAGVMSTRMLEVIKAVAEGRPFLKL